MAEAFHIASTGRCGPVLVDIPKDIFEKEDRFQYPQAREIPGYKPTYEGHGGQIAKAVKAIAAARKPVIFAGGGTIRSGAAANLKELAEKACIPVTLTLMGLGAFPGTNALFLGMPGMHGTVAANYALSATDLIIAVGVRFDDRVTGKLDSFASGARIIHIDIDPAEIGKNVAVHIPIVGDVGRVLRSLVHKLKPGDTASWREQIAEWKRLHPLEGGSGTGPTGRLRPQFVIREIYRITRGEAVISTDVGQHQMWTAQHYLFDRPRRFLSSGGLGTMGYGFPAAVGAALALPEETVFCIAGDGSFQMNLQELATAAANRAEVKVAVINNGYLGMVRQWQELFWGRRYSHTALAGSPDFVRVAEAYGIPGLRVSRVEEVAPAVAKALATPGPFLLDCVVEPEENVLPMVPPNKPIHEILTGGSGR